MHSDNNSSRKSPFVGLTPYSDSDYEFFYGREEEVGGILKLLHNQQVTIIYGKSGAGKTSIIKAGLEPRLRNDGYKVVYNRINFFSDEISPLSQLKHNLIQEAVNEVDSENPMPEKETLLNIIEVTHAGEAKTVLIFDQFEEIFNATNIIAARDFLIQLNEVVQLYKSTGSLDNFKVLISLREDYLARLEQLCDIFPGIVQPKFHVGDLTLNTAFEIIVNLGKGEITHEAAQLIVDKLRKPNSDNPLITNSDSIEVPMLQLLLFELEEVRVQQQKSIIDVSLIRSVNLNDLYLSFVKECLKFNPLSEQQALINLLISNEGKRLMVDFNIFRHSREISLDTIYKLIDRKILRRHLTASAEYVEVSHDILIEPLQRLNGQIKYESIKNKEIEKIQELKKVEIALQKKLQGEYDVAISYAREDGDIAERIAEGLKESGYNVFYDKFEQANLWGKNLYTQLNDIYGNKARFCLMIISKYYAQKRWTSHEREAAQAKAFSQNEEYILPLRLDDTKIPGINETVAYVNFKDTAGVEDVVLLLKDKLNYQNGR